MSTMIATYYDQINPSAADIKGPFELPDDVVNDARSGLTGARNRLAATLRDAKILVRGTRITEYRFKGDALTVFASTPGFSLQTVVTITAKLDIRGMLQRLLDLDPASSNRAAATRIGGTGRGDAESKAYIYKCDGRARQEIEFVTVTLAKWLQSEELRPVVARPVLTTAEVEHLHKLATRLELGHDPDGIDDPAPMRPDQDSTVVARLLRNLIADLTELS